MNSRVLATALVLAAMFDPAIAQTPDLATIAQASGTPEIPGLNIVWLAPWGEASKAHRWRNIIVHQTEGPAGSARGGALEQAKNPTRRGVTVWVETDGAVYWAVPENLVPTHGDGANRNDNKYIDNGPTFHQVIGSNSIGVEFAGNYPDVTRGATEAQIAAWRILVRVLRARYGIPIERVYAHNWIDYKDARYCEGCALATQARQWGRVGVRYASSRRTPGPLRRDISFLQRWQRPSSATTGRGGYGSRRSPGRRRVLLSQSCPQIGCAIQRKMRLIRPGPRSSCCAGAASSSAMQRA